MPLTLFQQLALDLYGIKPKDLEKENKLKEVITATSHKYLKEEKKND